jgi:phage replication-related protein YjqB (UPF0714/DUF867 family)
VLAIAGKSYSAYRFEGLRPRPHRDLHVTSTRFDEPRCLRLVARCDIVVAVHGLRGTTPYVDIGGRDHALRGFSARIVTTGDHAATSPANICNRGRRGAGVQLELTRALRTALRREPGGILRFADAVRTAIKAHLE